MEPGRKVQGKRQVEGVRQFLRPRQRFVAAPQGLVWIAQYPQSLGDPDSAPHSGVVPVVEHLGAVLLGVIERDPLLPMRAGLGKLAKIQQAFCKHKVGPQAEPPIVEALRQAEELLIQVVRRL
jgi:hypothetical protein